MERASDFELQVFADLDALAYRVADWLIETASAKVGTITIGLSGGSTPRRLYEILGDASEAMPWRRVHLFWGDERFVPPSNPMSNFRMVHEALLSRVPVPAANVHPIPFEGDPSEAANAYERELMQFYGANRLYPERPFFDVVLLDLGTDGHTASLLPDSSALDEHVHWATAVIPRAGGEPHITLTYPALESSHNVAFLVAGNGKRQVLGRFRDRDRTMPATRLRPNGTLIVFADQEAAGDGSDMPDGA
jgi:6-phosphogluconolactonase